MSLSYLACCNLDTNVRSEILQHAGGTLGVFRSLRGHLLTNFRIVPRKSAP